MKSPLCLPSATPAFETIPSLLSKPFNHRLNKINIHSWKLPRVVFFSDKVDVFAWGRRTWRTFWSPASWWPMKASANICLSHYIYSHRIWTIIMKRGSLWADCNGCCLHQHPHLWLDVMPELPSGSLQLMENTLQNERKQHFFMQLIKQSNNTYIISPTRKSKMTSLICTLMKRCSLH